MNDAPPISEERINKLLYTYLPNLKVHADQSMIEWCEILRDTCNCLEELRQWRLTDAARDEKIRVLYAKVAASGEKIEAGLRQIDEIVTRVNELASQMGEPPMT